MKKIITFFANNKLLVNLITIIIIVGGLFFIMNIKQDLFPETEMDAMMINAAYPGASARDVEINVTIPLEDKLKSINKHNIITTGKVVLNVNLLYIVHSYFHCPKLL